MRSSRVNAAALAVAALASRAVAITLDVSSESSIKAAASTAAEGMMSYYTGGGKFPDPYYWWEAGAVWGGLISYWHYTDDDTYNDVVIDALTTYITDDDQSFLPESEEYTEGNDDQAFWGFAVMAAAEYGFPSAGDDYPSWLQLAINVFNDFVGRWDTSSCSGGLRWQIYTWNNGYDYKNTCSNAGLFLLAARLARYTGNDTYVTWAEKSYDWMVDVGLISSSYAVYDGISTTDCSIDQYQWSYNNGMLMYGSAVLAEYLDSDTWNTRFENFLSASSRFFTPYSNSTDVMYEGQCEKSSNCSTDEQSFKAFLARWMAASIKMRSSAKTTIMTYLKASAEGAAAACTGGDDGTTCGEKWYIDDYDGKTGLGEELAAMEVFQVLLVNSASSPETSSGSSTESTESTVSSSDSSSSASAAAAASASEAAAADVSTSAAAATTSTAAKTSSANSAEAATSVVADEDTTTSKFASSTSVSATTFTSTLASASSAAYSSTSTVASSSEYTSTYATSSVDVVASSDIPTSTFATSTVVAASSAVAAAENTSIESNTTGSSANATSSSAFVISTGAAGKTIKLPAFMSAVFGSLFMGVMAL